MPYILKKFLFALAVGIVAYLVSFFIYTNQINIEFAEDVVSLINYSTGVIGFFFAWFMSPLPRY